MLRILILMMAVVAPGIANAAEPSGSQIAWTAETLKLVKGGNMDKGKNLAESCKTCHGDIGQGVPEEVVDGEIIPAIPALAGQTANYTFKQLRDYFNGDRTNAAMTSVAKGLSEQDAADLAAWFAWLPAPKEKPNNDNNLAVAEKLVKQGDGKRIIPPCFVCHGADGRGEKMDIPSLAGQQLDYLVRVMMAYRSGERHNDVYSRMRLIAKQLSDDEIKLLARYYRDLD